MTETSSHFADRLIAAVCSKGNPVLVGLDPRVENLPPEVIESAKQLLRANNLPAEKQQIEGCAIHLFCRRVIDVIAPLVPAIKPQAAFFEQLGHTGMSTLHAVIQYAASQGLLVILDGKRNDIGSTASGYAEAYLGPGDASPWGCDALTVSPYLGDDSLTPFVDIAKKRGAGIFVLVKTSNPGGKRFQDLVADGRPLYRHVGDYVESLAQQTAGSGGYGCVGAVVGATYPEQLAELRKAMPHTWFLIPGFGAQGGTAKDCAPAFDANGLGAIVNNSRGIIFAHSRPEYRELEWQEAVEAATRDMIERLRAETSASRLAKQ
jgi:orotidine-5'-phosphate decarboxylase